MLLQTPSMHVGFAPRAQQRPTSAAPPPSTWVGWLRRIVWDGAEPAEVVRAWMAVRQAVFEDLYDEAQLVSSRKNVRLV